MTGTTSGALTDVPGLDPELGFLVHLADTTGVSVGVVLTTAGGLIGGRLIGVSAYFDGLAHEMGRVPGQETLGEAVLGMFRLRAAIRADHLAKQGVEDDGAVPSGFVHLADAWFVGSGGQETMLGPWRGRLSEVTGWTFSTFTS